MARKPGIWWWKQRREWCVTIDGQRHRLGPDKDVAEQAFHKLMAAPKVSSSSVAAIVDKFLDWTESHRAQRSFEYYKGYLLDFLDSINPRMSVDVLKGHHVEDWTDSHDGWGPTVRGNAMTCVLRCLNWAEKRGHIEKNPLRGKLEKPTPATRERVMSDEQYQALLQHAGAEFRDLLTVGWETGARPQELVAVQAQHVELKHSRWVFPIAESKGKREQRVIYLTPAAIKITKRLMEAHPEGPLFRNTAGEPWGKNAVRKTFERLEKYVGARWTLYDLRHAFATRGILNGVDLVTLQRLMGHADLTMLSKIYAKAHKNVSHMLAAVQKVTG